MRNSRIGLDEKINLLKNGYDGKMKIEYLQSISQSKSTQQSYSKELINIMNYESKCGKSIFNLSEDEAKQFVITESMGASSQRNRLGTVIKQYYEIYKLYNLSSENNLLVLLSSSKLLNNSFTLDVQRCFTSYDNLLNTSKMFEATPFDIAIVSLLYMGFGREEISELKVNDIDFDNRSIMTTSKYYYDIEEKLFRNITYRVKDGDNGQTLICDAPRSGSVYRAIPNRLKRLNDKAKATNAKVEFVMKNIWQSGAFYYLKIRENEFGRNTDEKFHEVLRCFNSINKDQISKGWDNRCKNDFNAKYDKFIARVDSDTRLFRVQFLPENTVVKVGDVLRGNIAMDDIDFPEEPRGEDGDSKYERQLQIGKENERLILDNLKKIKGCTDCGFMADYSGFDIKAAINKKTLRIEVKTLDSDLQFYLTRNELRTAKVKDVIIALVLNKNKNNVQIKMLPNVIDTLNLNYEKLIDIGQSSEYCIRSEDFKIKLSEQLYNNLKTFDLYFEDVFKIKED